MKIWIDFINTPQVTFFIPFIQDFKKEKHSVILTCRDSGNTIALLQNHNLHFHIIGSKVGKGLIEKLLFFPIRSIKLFLFIRRNKPDIAVSQSSFYQPIIAKIFNIPCLYTNDNEHAKGNIFGFLFANMVFLPIALKDEKLTKKWSLKRKIFFYPGVKEAIYLSQFPDLFNSKYRKKNKIYFRPEPWTAQYYKGQMNFFDNTLIKLSNDYEVVILPRDHYQISHYSNKKFSNLNVALNPVRLQQIVSDCLLFIGAGGSMTREMAVIGLPVISVYQEELLCVDKYLVDNGLMIINPIITYSQIEEYIKIIKHQNNNWSMIEEGHKSYEIIKNHIYRLKNE